jgi:hypothetical protein
LSQLFSSSATTKTETAAAFSARADKDGGGLFAFFEEKTFRKPSKRNYSCNFALNLA